MVPAFRRGAGPLVLALFLLPFPVSANPVLTLEVTEAPGGTAAAARLSVTGSDDLPSHPLPDSVGLYHHSIDGFSYFYVDSAASLSPPPGPTRIVATRGPEYGAIDFTFDLAADTTITLVFERWIEPRDSGWMGGDTHGDLTHDPPTYVLSGSDAKMITLAEGLRVANFLDNGFLFTGAVNSLSDSSVILFSSEEYRSPFYGHLGLLGIDSLIVPMNGQMGWPLNAGVTEEARGHQSALAVYTHPMTTTDFFDVSDWPGCIPPEPLRQFQAEN